MSKLFRAVTALFVTLALACAPLAQAQSVGFGGGSLPPNEQVLTGSVSSAANLWSIRTGGYNSFVVQFTSIGASNVISCEASNDNTNWLLIPVRQFVNTALDPSTSFAPSTSTLWGGSLNGSFFRCRVSTYGSGTVTAKARLTEQPSTFVQATITSNGAVPSIVVGNVASGATDSSNPVKVGCKYNAAKPTFTDGQRGDCQIGTRGSIFVTLAGNDTTTVPSVAAVSPTANSGTPNSLAVISYPQAYNGTNSDSIFTCPSQATISVTSGNTTQLVALSASTVIRVCSFVITESLAGSATFVDGTGANCATSPSNLTAAMVLATNGSIAVSAGNGSLFRGRAGNALCLTSATGTITGFISYAQF